MRYLWRGWRMLRTISGDDAYERYLLHWLRHHGKDRAPLERKAFFKQEQERKWHGVKRCC